MRWFPKPAAGLRGACAAALACPRDRRLDSSLTTWLDNETHSRLDDEVRAEVLLAFFGEGCVVRELTAADFQSYAEAPQPRGRFCVASRALDQSRCAAGSGAFPPESATSSRRHASFR